MNGQARVRSAASIVGARVINTTGDQLGMVKELMIDLDDGQVAYVVMSFGGFLGMGDKLFAIPLEALTFTTDDHTAILDVEKDVLKEAPGFDKDHWPENAQYEAGWLLALYEYYGYSPYWMPDK